MKVSSWRSLNKDDFDEKDGPLIETLATPINSAMDEIYNNLNNNLDFTNNINATIASFQVAVGTDGNPKSLVKFKLKTNQTVVQGIIPIALKTNTNQNIIPASGVFVSGVQDGNLVTVQNIKGLTPDTAYNVTVLVI